MVPDLGVLTIEQKAALKKMSEHMIKARNNFKKREYNDASSEENWAFTIGFYAGLASNGNFHEGTVVELPW